MTTRKTNVMFIQGQPDFGADSMIHSILMRHLDRHQYQVYAAANRGDSGKEAASFKVLEKIPNLHIRPTHFGPSTYFRSPVAVARDTISSFPPAMLSLSSLVRYVRKHKIDILHGTQKPRDAFYGVILSRLTGAKMLIHIHVGVDLNWMKPITQQWAMHQADALVGVSEFVSETAREAGFDPRKIYSVPNSLDLSDWDATDPNSVRREFGIAVGTPIMLIVSRINPYKGHEILLRALAHLKQQRNLNDFKLLIVGTDDRSSTPGGISYTGVIRALIADLQLDEHVIFTGYRSDIRNLMAGSDIYTMPSYKEPFGVVYIEAGAMGLPVISLNNGGTPEVVQHGITGFLSEPGNIDELATNLHLLLGDRELRQRMGEAGRKRVERVLNPTNMAQQMHQVYQQVLQRDTIRG